MILGQAPRLKEFRSVEPPMEFISFDSVFKAKDKKDAINKIKKFYGYKRLPKNTYILEISIDYYEKIVKNNQEIGIDITNM
ncbi:MAG: hypothetical protein FJW63_08570 [Actinobacteria bacterium]|nr:hypothetical protein [Actinomycetota bacterium]